MKKTLCLILSIIMSLSLLAVSAGAEAATGFEGQTLKVAAFEGGFGSSYWQKICDDFAAAYGVTVELTAIANGDMDAETWRQNTIDVFNRVAAGE